MPLADQLREIENQRNDLLDRIEEIIKRCEAEDRGFSDSELHTYKQLKAQVDGVVARHRVLCEKLEQQKLRAMNHFSDGVTPGLIFGSLSSDGASGESAAGAGTLREAIRRSGLAIEIAQSGNYTGRGTLRVTAKTLISGTAAPAVVPRHADLGAAPAQFGSTPLLGTLAFVVPVAGGIVSYSRVKIGSGAAAKQAPEGSPKANVVLAGEPILTPVSTFAAFEKISIQALADVDQLLATVETMLAGTVLDAISADIYAVATAAGNSTPFVPAAGDVPQDSIIKAAATIAATGAARVVVGVNPADFAAMATAKAQGGGGYLGVSPLMAMPSIIQSAAIPAGKLLASAADGSGLCFALRSDLDLTIGLDADDFTRNLRTALAEARGLPFVRAPARVLAGDLTAGASVGRTAK